MNNKRTQAAAFFDFDKTILLGDSQEMEFISILKQPRLWPTFSFPIKVAKIAVSDTLVNHHLMDPTTLHRCIFDAYEQVPLLFLERHGLCLYETSMKQKLFPRMLELIKNHKEKGHRIFLLSASTEHLLQAFVEELDTKFDAWRGTVVEVDANGKCTGKPGGPVMIGENKARAAEEIAKSYGIDLSNCYFYSDHHADLPLLYKVGNPVVVNPTRTLNEVAIQHKWPVISTTEMEETVDTTEEEEHTTKCNFLFR